jgi:hypothetical protein
MNTATTNITIYHHHHATTTKTNHRQRHHTQFHHPAKFYQFAHRTGAASSSRAPPYTNNPLSLYQLATRNNIDS